MKKLQLAATAVLVALTTVLLTACGPDDSTPPSADQSNAAANTATPAATPSGHETDPALTAHAAGASAALASTPDTRAASDSAVQSVQASLAGDSQQITPVLRYAPGDSDQSGHSN